MAHPPRARLFAPLQSLSALRPSSVSLGRRRRELAVGALLALGLAACGHDNNRGDDLWSRETAVGDVFADGREVLDIVSLGGGCELVTYAIPAEWKCSDDEVRAAESNGLVDLMPVDTEVSPAVGEMLFADYDVGEAQLEASSCSALADLKRDQLRAVAAKSVASAASSALEKCLPTTETGYRLNGEEVDQCTGTYGGTSTGAVTGTGYYGTGGTMGGTTTGSPGVPAVDPAQDSAGASEYSTTNNQVVGVEEADYVKNDSGHVFVLSGSSLRVFDTWPVEDSRQIARVELSAEPRRLLLAGDELVVFMRTGGNAYSDVTDQGCTYGYDCRYQGEGGETRIAVFDVSNPALPSEEATFDLPGGYVASRRIGRVVHTVVHNGANNVDLSLISGFEADIEESSPEGVDVRIRELNLDLDEYLAAIPDEKLLPQAESDHDQEGCGDALIASGAAGVSIVTLASFDLDEIDRVERTLIAAEPGYVYASASAIYMATDGLLANGSWYPRVAAESDVSAIHKFALDGTTVGYKGSALVRGHVLNQFAMDEYEGVLRVASTSGWVPDANVSSSLTTLAEKSGRLQRLGEITGLAATEDIRSVRFDGDRGFVVTFKKTDPLFAFDLADPADPVVEGELKIPGFSTYMHPIDRDHLLAVGFDTDDHGSFAYFDGIQVQLFDVSDMSNPSLLHKTVLGTRGSGSEALLNHLAFNYFPSSGLLAMPVTLCEGGDDGYYGTTMAFSGLVVFDVSIADGIVERGRLSFGDPATSVNYSAWNSECSQWWSSSTSNVKRSIFFDDFVFGLSAAEMRAAHVDAMDDLLVNLPLIDGPTDPTPLYAIDGSAW